MSPPSDMRNQVAVVTGASSGIGKAVALAFAAAGARVALVARSAAKLEAVAQEARQRGGNALAVPTDVTERAQVDAMVERVLREFGRIDVLVNNAGIGAHGPFWQTPYEDFERIVRVNFFGAAYCTSAVLPHMIARHAGRIVNVSSIIGKRAYPGNAAYCASKFALEGFAEALRTEVRHHGIRVIQVCPGFTETEFFDHLLQTGGHRRPHRRGMSPDRVAALLLRAVQRDRREIVVSLRGKLLVLLDTFVPGLLDRLLAARFRRRFPGGEMPSPDPARPT
jgi:NAD(P)-dependent dehydrogenase (short-subunit alcohol dehydrogenase family)